MEKEGYQSSVDAIIVLIVTSSCVSLAIIFLWFVITETEALNRLNLCA